MEKQLLRDGKYILRGVLHTFQDWRSSACIACFLCVLGLVYAFLGGRWYMHTLVAENAVPLVLHEAVDMHEARTLYSALQSMPFVSKMRYVTREELAQTQQASDMPVADTFFVHVRSVSGYGYLGALLLQQELRPLVHPSTLTRLFQEEQRMRQAEERVQVLYYVLGVLLLIVMCMSFFVLSGVVREQAHRESLAVQHVLGATPEHSVTTIFMFTCVVLCSMLVLSIIVGWSMYALLRGLMPPVSLLHFSSSELGMGILLVVVLLFAGLIKGLRDHFCVWHTPKHLRRLSYG